MKNVEEFTTWRIDGFVALLLEAGLLAVIIWMITGRVGNGADGHSSGTGLELALLVLVFAVALRGFLVIRPNESSVLLFFGNYTGSLRRAGFHWTNPLTTRKTVSLRVRNFNSEAIKVNDETGNPIEIAAVIVWNVTDTAKAFFNVDNYESFVSIQSETAIRNLASHHPYDAEDSQASSLRGNPDAISNELKVHLTDRLESAGVSVVEARISHLAYAPEIAQTMLRRQQAAAVIAARRLIVEGAVGMVKSALQSLEESGVVKLDEERKASMVNNLLVSLVSESQSQPVINTGTLYG